MNVKLDTLIRIAQALDVGLADIAQGVVPRPCRQEAMNRPQVLEEPPLPAGQVRVDTAKFVEVHDRTGMNVKQLVGRACRWA